MNTIPKEVQALVDEAANKLMEHVDSIQIFVTKHDGSKDESASYETGRGNFYARLGQAHEWLCIMDQYTRNHAIRKDAEE